MIQHEMENNSFLFKHPKIDPNRPSQLKVKIDKIEEVLEKWRVRAEVITQSTTSQDKPNPADSYAQQPDGTWRRTNKESI
ncbi:unnamed protein product [marine sediment metagenome]|uniref:Uncharacterized protein n=1 Tax=marine sediment metagenome TaxID=412755 RepID=X1T5H4_9ZZZZ